MCINMASYLHIPSAFSVVIVLRVMNLTLKQDYQKNRNFHLCLFNHYPYVFCDLLAKNFITFFLNNYKLFYVENMCRFVVLLIIH